MNVMMTPCDVACRGILITEFVLFDAALDSE